MKNYDVLHYIDKQVTSRGYSAQLSQALQELFNFMDTTKESSGCIIGSVVASLILTSFGIDHTMHLGEIGYETADGEDTIDAYHCWLTVNDEILDIGIYGNSVYNPFYLGKKLKRPIIFDSNDSIIYMDGSTEQDSWLSELSGKSFTEYMEHCPANMVVKMAIRCLNLPYTMEGQNQVYALAKDLYFPQLQLISASPSGRKGLHNVSKDMKYTYTAKRRRTEE